MATFTITTAQNIDQLTGKAGGDIYNINGGYLTIDQDSRTGLNTTDTTGALGNITLSSTLGGTCHIDGSAIWIIPYTGGSGTMPAFNTVISNGTGSGKLIGVCANVAEYNLVAPGNNIPATGFVRIKQKTGTFQAGALTGITATASDAGRTGWIEVAGVESSTCTVPRLGTFKVTGAWFKLGTTSGTSNQLLYVPMATAANYRYIPGVFIEKTAGQEDYEFYPNAGVTTTTGTEATRGKVVWIDNKGIVRIGNSGAATNGYTPAAGLSVVIPNVIFENCTTANKGNNTQPNTTLATRYDFTTTGGGVLEIDKASMNWYLSAAQPYSVTLSNSGFSDAMALSEVASPMNFSKVGVGNRATSTISGMVALSLTQCTAGGTFTDCVWARPTQTTSDAHIVSLTDITGFTFIRDTVRGNTIKTSVPASHFCTRVNGCTWTTPTIIQGPMSFVACSNITVTDLIYCNVVSGITTTTYTTDMFIVSTKTTNCMFSGVTIPIYNTHPESAFLVVNAAGCNDITLRNIGTYASPLDLGSSAQTSRILNIANAAAASNIKIKRVYVSNTRTFFMSSDNSSTDITLLNASGDYADASDTSTSLNMIQMGGCRTKSLTAQTAVYGTHWMDYFTSTTAGRIAIAMNEPTVSTSSQVSLTNGASFTSAGSLYMPTIGMTATFTMPSYIIGHTGFSNTALVMAGGTATNYTYAYQIDKNDGNGYSAWSSEYTAANLGTTLSGITGINALLGFKLKLRITTSTTNTTAITSVYVTTTSTTTTQAYQYPLDDPRTLTLTGLQSNCDVVFLQAGTSTELVNIDQNPTSSYAYSYYYAAGTYVDIGIFKTGYVPFYIRNYLLQDGNASIPVAQTPDRNFA